MKYYMFKYFDLRSLPNNIHLFATKYLHKRDKQKESSCNSSNKQKACDGWAEFKHFNIVNILK